jgi:hypothetical protein
MESYDMVSSLRGTNTRLQGQQNKDRTDKEITQKRKTKERSPKEIIEGRSKEIKAPEKRNQDRSETQRQGVRTHCKRNCSDD